MRLLIELAQSLKDIARDLQSISRSFQEHLIKLYIWRDVEETANYWKREISNFITEIVRVKGSKKFPSKKFIYDKIFGEWEDVFIDYLPKRLENILSNYSSMPQVDVKAIKANELLSFVKEYCNWLSTNLSRDGIISSAEARNKLDELLEKYPL